MIGVSIDLVGDRKLQRAFSKLAGNVQKQYVRKALRAGAKEIMPTVKARASVISPRLARGMKIRALRRSRRRIGVRILTPTRDELGILAKDPHFWPAAQELGWTVKGGGRVMPARSYLRSALHDKRAAAQEKIRRELWIHIRNGVRAAV